MVTSLHFAVSSLTLCLSVQKQTMEFVFLVLNLIFLPCEFGSPQAQWRQSRPSANFTMCENKRVKNIFIICMKVMRLSHPNGHLLFRGGELFTSAQIKMHQMMVFGDFIYFFLHHINTPLLAQLPEYNGNDEKLASSKHQWHITPSGGAESRFRLTTDGRLLLPRPFGQAWPMQAV